jgi:Rps23 Pro-64 3,4-dihydroxylase Tpa1-like proline 4-hydroxylase
MNTNFENSKQHFIENGYCNASLKDIDLDFYNFLETNFLCNENYNIQNKFNNLRFDSKEFETVYNSPIKSFEDTKLKKEEYLNLYESETITQCWYFAYEHNIENRDKISKGIYNICKYYYDLSDNISLDNNELFFTYYDTGCRFLPHNDSSNINLCSIIIYLNKDYKKENGGLLLLNDEEIIPEFGNIGLMDLSKCDIKHGVSEVTGGPGRYAILVFTKLKN